jgi:hypothetical protein
MILVLKDVSKVRGSSKYACTYGARNQKHCKQGLPPVVKVALPVVLAELIAVQQLVPRVERTDEVADYHAWVVWI